jgi:hypothetical protein
MYFYNKVQLDFVSSKPLFSNLLNEDPFILLKLIEDPKNSLCVLNLLLIFILLEIKIKNYLKHLHPK